ncbi:hemagglutinin repeat-containing protein [Xylophilus sp. GOD-11R]|uniref:hemagglutinin repeat-containing protein n=1 Tax=Xylophilus sp. GOD-11R TaxID=3089814 RepID=UPI00298CD92A|nr:hemagglutinin repeat-containing protein [Xylophilus sp. GOD-11R]WPB59202.1 hemagglutinin repeat-containing protein [Xylophilus sp. GOD-11R]
MNRQSHRLVFNRARGALMAVQESAAGSGKAASGDRRAGSVVIGLVLCAAAVQAQIAADPTAPGTQRPTVLQAPNGVPLVDIQTPSAAGVSRNTYRQFDVARPGAILNNSRGNTQTQLGGWVQGNPWMAAGSARVILNEVNSSDPSRLRGHIEVAGPRAEVVIANPAGIAVDGAGFINASRVTLTTGVPVFEGGNLESFRVRQGSVTIEGAGLDLGAADHGAILARAIALNAGLWAQHLTVAAGAHDASADASTVTAATGTPADRPRFALDVAAIGGMYAHKIWLIGTEAGLGVRNDGTLSAAGEFVMTADGRLENRGTIQARGDLAIRTAQDVQNTGAQALIRSEANAAVTSAGGITNTEGTTIGAAGTLGLDAARGLNNRASTIVAAGDLRIASTSIDNQGGHIASSQGVLSLDTLGGALDNRAGAITGRQDVGLTTGTLDNRGGTFASEGTASVSSGILDNHQGLIQAGGALALDTHGQAIDNTDAAGHASHAGGIVAGGALAIASGALDNTAGYVGSGGPLSATVTGDITNIGSGVIQSESNLSLAAAAIHNGTGAIKALGDVAMTTTALDNTAGRVAANGDLTIAGGQRIDNTDGRLVAGRDLSLGATNPGSLAPVITSATGTLQSGRHTRIQASDLQAGSVLAGGDLDLDLAADFTNTGTLAAGGNARITAAGRFTNQAEVSATDSLRIVAQTIDNTAAGDITASNTHLQASDQIINRGLIDGTATRLDAATVSNLGTGRIYGDHVALGADTLTNDAETIAGKTDTPVIAARQRLDIGAGHIVNRQGALILSAGSADDALAIGGALDASGHATGSAASLDNTAATIESLGGAFIAASAVRNTNPGLTTRTEHRTEQLTEASEVEYIVLGGVRYLESELGRCNRCAADRFDNGATSLERLEYVAPSARYPFEKYSRVPYTLEESRIVTADTEAGPQQTTFFERYFYPEDSSVWALFEVPVGQHDELRQRLTAYNQDLISRAYRDYDRIRVKRTETEQTVVDNPGTPGRILAGGDLRIDAGHVFNTDSQILAGGQLALDGRTLVNQETPGERVVTGYGDFRRDHVEYDPYRVREGRYGAGDYVGVVENVTTTLGSAQALGDTRPVGSGVQPGARHTVLSTGEPGQQVLSIDTSSTGWTVPTSGLFRPSPSPATGYLIETDPRFTDQRRWLSSDYLLEALGLRPASIDKRLGDGFYEQRLVREQVAQLTGRPRLAGYASDQAQYQGLLDAAATFATQWQLVPGVALSAQQMAQLTSDIVWLVEREVSLPDGSTTTALVPQVYVRTRAGDLAPDGALLAGRQVDIRLTEDARNTGTIAGREVVTLTARNVDNLGRIAGADATVRAEEDLRVTGGRIEAETNLSASAGRDLTVESTTRTASATSGRSTSSLTQVDRVAGLYVTGKDGKGGTLVASAGRDVTLVAGVLDSQGEVRVEAGRDLNLTTLTTAERSDLTADERNYLRQAATREVGSLIRSGGDTALSAGQDLITRAATVDARGDLAVTATRDVRISEGRATTASDDARYARSSGLLSSYSQASREQRERDTAIGSDLGGKTVTITSGRDTLVRGSTVIGDEGVAITAGRGLTIEAAREQERSATAAETKRSGLMGSGGFGVTLGSQAIGGEQTRAATSAAASTVGAIAGDVTLTAGGTYTQTGSDVLAPEGDIAVTARNVRITEARETERSTTEQHARQSGLTLAVTSPVIAAAQSAVASAEATGDTGSARMKLLGAASTAMSGATAVGGLQDAASSGGGGVNLALSVGASRSSSTTTTTSDSARASTVQARNVTIRATGGGQDSDLLIQGSEVTARQDVTLEADHRIDIVSAQDTNEQHSKNSSSAASVGVSFGTDGLMFNASASGARGRADGSETRQVNSHVTGGRQLSIQSGGDTTLAGGVVQAAQVRADIGGNLVIESRQDTAKFDSRQQSLGGSVSLGYGRSGGSLSVGQSRVDADYASVAERSGFQAGDGGFQVKVQGDTSLTGGAIASTEGAVQAGRNTFETTNLTTRDIENREDWHASGFSFSGGYSSGGGGKPSDGSAQGATPNAAGGVNGAAAGIGRTSGHAASTTTSGVSGIAGDTSVRTDDDAQGIEKKFDAQKVQKEVAAQVQITATFGQQAAKAIGDYADAKYRELKESDPTEAAKWAEGGSYRVAAHTVLGGLTGGVQGALGAGGAAAAAAAIDRATTILPEGIRQAVGGALAVGIGAALGSEFGVAGAFNEDLNNRQLHIVKSADIKIMAEKEASNSGISAEKLYLASMLVLGDYFDAAGEIRPEFARISAEEYMAAQRILLSQPAGSAIAREMAQSQQVVLPQFAISDEHTISVGRIPGMANPQIRFGRNENQESHAFRHSDETGVARSDIKTAINKNLNALGPILSEGPYNGTIAAGGRTFDFTGFLRNGEINVGRITPRN